MTTTNSPVPPPWQAEPAFALTPEYVEALTNKPKVNPFTAPPPPPKPFPPEELFDRSESTPPWGTFVQFIMKYGEKIDRAEYPNPPRYDPSYPVDRPITVDTLWKGVPVFNAPAARVHHIAEGWVDWAECIS